MFEHLFRKPPEDESIPVLTEIIEPTRPGDASEFEPAAPSPATAAPRAPSIPIVEPRRGNAAMPTTVEDTLEAQSRAAIVARIDAVIEQRIQDAIAATLDAELPALRDKLRAAVIAAIGDAVATARSNEPRAQPAQPGAPWPRNDS